MIQNIYNSLPNLSWIGQYLYYCINELNLTFTKPIQSSVLNLKRVLNMSFIKFLKCKKLTDGDISHVIQMAWEDRTSFETIKERVRLTEAEVIRLMRSELKPQSFSMWRKRVAGRATQHRALRSPEMKFHDRQIADHRQANC
jgi:uncharacterized protein (TIGR03643 family)